MMRRHSFAQLICTSVLASGIAMSVQAQGISPAAPNAPPPVAQAPATATLSEREYIQQKAQPAAVPSASAPAPAPTTAPATSGAVPIVSTTPIYTSRALPIYALLANTAYKPLLTSVYFPADQQNMLDQIQSLRAQGRTEEAMNLVGATLRQDPIDALMGKAGAAGSTTTITPVTPPPDIPFFYLSSIMYHSENDWALWINGKRYTARAPKSADGKISVESITPDEATISWAPTQFARLQAMIGSQALGAPSKHYTNAADSTGKFSVDDAAKRILFTLHINQTFYTKAVRIGEGLPFRDRHVMGQLPTDAQIGGGGMPPLVQKYPSATTAPAAELAPPAPTGTPAMPNGAAPSSTSPAPSSANSTGVAAPDSTMPIATPTPVVTNAPTVRPMTVSNQTRGTPPAVPPVSAEAYHDANGVIQRNTP